MAFFHPPHPLSALPAAHSLTRGGAPGPHFSSVTNFFLKKECGRGQQELKYGSQFQTSSAPACVVLAGLPGPRASPALSKGCRWDKSSAAGGGGWGRALWGPHWGPSPLRTIKPTRPSCLSAQRRSPVPALWEHRSVYRQLVLWAVNDRADPPLPPTVRWNIRPDGSHLDPGSTKLTLPASPLAENILPSLPPSPPMPACTGPFPCLVRCPGSCPSWPVRSRGPRCPDSCSYRALPREFATGPKLQR